MAKKDGTLDLRIKRTQLAIKKAFYELVDEKGFEHITVKNITDRAMISRNTFYLHYKDKYDLLNKICNDLTRKLFFCVGKQVRHEQRSLDVDIESAVRVMQIGINTIDEDREAYRVLLNSSGSDLLVKKNSDAIRRALDLLKDDTDSISEYSIEYIVSGLNGIIKYYINNPNDNFEENIYPFVRLHLGAIINSMCESWKKSGRAEAENRK